MRDNASSLADCILTQPFLLLLVLPAFLAFLLTAIHLGHLKLKPNIELDRVRDQINASFNYTFAVTGEAPALAVAEGAIDICSSVSGNQGATSVATTPATMATVTTDYPKQHQQQTHPSFSSSLSTEDSVSTPTGPMLLLPSEDDSIDMQFVHTSSSSDSLDHKLSTDWCFIDSCTAERFFRIDRAQEHLHYVVDICNEELYILDSGEMESQSLSQLEVSVDDPATSSSSFAPFAPSCITNTSKTTYTGHFLSSSSSSASPTHFIASDCKQPAAAAPTTTTTDIATCVSIINETSSTHHHVNGMTT